jgi:S1-C subfamily serine protease
VQSNGFLINPKKTRVGTPLNSKYVTGVKVNLKLNVPRNFVRQIRAMLHDWEANGLKTASARYNARFNLSEQNKDFVRVVAGKLSHLKKVKGHTDLAYRRLYNRFVRLEGKGNPVLPLGEIEELREKVFVMEGCSDKGLPKVGSSFVLNEKYLVTCRHTLEISDTAEFPPPLVRTAKFYPFYDFSEVSKRTVDVHAEYTSHEADIALLDISAADKTVAKSLKSADPAEPLLESKMDLYKVVGFPAYKPGMSPHVMPLAITGTQPNQYGVKEIYVSSKMIAGMSGGPVLNQKNEVVGMAIRGTSTRATGDDSVGYLFVPISEVLKLAEEKGMVFK